MSSFTTLTVGGVPITGGPPTNLPVRQPIAGSLVIFVGATASQVVGDGVLYTNTLFGSTGALVKLQNRTNRGDIIYLLPGYTENITAADMGGAGSGSNTASGYSIIGLGTGTQRPALSWTAAASTWLLNQSGIELANLTLNFAVTAATVVVTPITVSAANCRIIGCSINWGASTTIGCGSTLGAIALTTAADYFEFSYNFCNNLDVAGTNAICLLSVNGGDFLKVTNNKIFGATTAATVGPIHFLTTLSSDVEITWNYIENLIASSTIALSSAIAGVTGTVSYNQFRVKSGIQPVTVSSNMSTTLFQNFCANTVNGNGALVVGAGTST